MKSGISVALLLLLLAGCKAEPPAATSASGSVQSDTARTYLFVQQADSGIVALGRDSMPDVLVLFGVDDATTWFTDRPHRDAGVMNTGHFLDVWGLGKDSFTADPPNAALMTQGSDGQRAVYPIEIFNPQYDSRSGTLSYQIRPLEGASSVLRTGSARHVRESPRQFASASLFIDTDNNWCLLMYGKPCDSSPQSAPTPQARPNCPAGQHALQYADGTWSCVVTPPPAPITCPQGCTAVGPMSPEPGPITQWRCVRYGFVDQFCGTGTPNP